MTSSRFVTVTVTVTALLAAAPAFAGSVEIRHTAAQTVEKSTELVLKATILASAGVYAPTVVYRVGAISKSWFSVPMIQMDGDVYGGAIPGLFVQGDIEYYIEAYDAKLHQAQAGSKEKPFKVTATEPKPTRSTITITSEPEAVAIKIDDDNVGITPVKDYELDPGAHTLTATKPGFRSYDQSFDLPEGRDLALHVALQPKAAEATFAVQSEPLGARLSVDGKQVGVTPYIGPAPVGDHILWLEREGYLRQERSVHFTADRSVEVSFTLTKLPPQPALAVTTDPPGAVLSVDGNDVGKTPFIGVIPAGDHELVIRKDGFKSLGNSFVMPDGRDLDLRFTLEVPPEKPAPPRIAVSSDPIGASVLLDGKEVGQTPFLAELASGDHVVKLARKGFIAYQRKIFMPKDRDVEVTLALIPEPPPPGPSKVDIASEPPGLAVTVDGKEAGKTPFSMTLPSGEHKLGGKADGYRKTEQAITVTQGQSLAVKLALDKLPPEANAPQLTLNTEPPGAKVLLDGKPAGVTPYSEPSTPGAHEVTVTLDGFKDRTEKFKLPSDRDFELKYAFVLAPTRQSVQLVSAVAPPPKPEVLGEANPAAQRPQKKKKSKDTMAPSIRLAPGEKPPPPAPGATAPASSSASAAAAAQPEVRRRGGAPAWAYATIVLSFGAIGAGGYFGYQANQTVQLIAAGQAVNQDQLRAALPQQEYLALGLAGGGGLLAAVIGFVWLATGD